MPWGCSLSTVRLARGAPAGHTSGRGGVEVGVQHPARPKGRDCGALARALLDQLAADQLGGVPQREGGEVPPRCATHVLTWVGEVAVQVLGHRPLHRDGHTGDAALEAWVGLRLPLLHHVGWWSGRSSGAGRGGARRGRAAGGGAAGRRMDQMQMSKKCSCLWLQSCRLQSVAGNECQMESF